MAGPAVDSMATERSHSTRSNIVVIGRTVAEQVPSSIALAVDTDHCYISIGLATSTAATADINHTSRLGRQAAGQPASFRLADSLAC